MLVVLILDAHAQLLQLLQHHDRCIFGLTAAMCIATSLAAASSVEPSRTVRTPMRPPMCRWAPNASASVFDTISKRRSVSFSPILA